MKFFNSPRPVGEMFLGAIFIVMGVVIGPLVPAPGDRAAQNVLNSIPAPILIGVLVLAGVVIFIQGLGTWLKRRK
jgi:hypothetical protein